MQKAVTVLLAAVILVGGYYFLIYEPNHKVAAPVVPAVVTPTAQVVTATPTPSTDETAAIIAAVKKGLVAEHGSDAATMTITVSSIEGNYAKGMASAQAGGGMWLAAKVNGEWKLVWDGNGTISCTSVNPYNFPTSMVPECWNEATQKTVTR